MADEHVRRTLRELAARTGDAYVPLSEVVGLLRSRAVRCGDMEPKAWWSQRGFGRASTQLRVAADSLERRWGLREGPRCWWCREGSSYRPCDCEAARG